MSEENLSDYPRQDYRSYFEHPCAPGGFTARQTTLGYARRAIPFLLAALLGAFLARAWPKPAPKEAAQTFQVATIADCQFMIFSNPFFVLHFPKCSNHPVLHIPQPTVEAPKPTPGARAIE